MESELVTVMTFNHSHEMLSVRALLETRGIECFTRDELTAQTATHYAFAVGGIKLMVRQEDAEQALRLLIDAGYLNEKALEIEEPLFNIDKLISKFPILRSKRFQFLLPVSILVFFCVLFFLVYQFTKPTTFEILTSNDWCLANVTFKNKRYESLTNMMEDMSFMTNCNESISFYRDGSIRLPGFDSEAVKGKWRIENEKLYISDVNNFDSMYNGIFEIEVNKNLLDLKSINTTLNLYEKSRDF